MADKIVTWLNMGYGIFIVAMTLFAIIFIDPIAIIGLIIGVVLMFVSWKFLMPVKKEGWLYAFIINIITVPLTVILVGFPMAAYFVTFAILIIIIMLVPPIRKPYT